MEKQEQDWIPLVKADRKAAVDDQGGSLIAPDEEEEDDDERKRLGETLWETEPRATPMLTMTVPPVTPTKALPPEPAHFIPPANGKPGRVAPAKPYRFSPAPATGGATKHTKPLVKPPLSGWGAGR